MEKMFHANNSKRKLKVVLATAREILEQTLLRIKRAISE
jgi:hypothetical protein